MGELVIPESIAASGVATAAMRANEGTRPDALFDDPLARLLVSLADEVAEYRRAYLADGKNQTSPMTHIMGEYLPVRTHFFDTHLRATAEAGARQIVLLGSGLDVRAFRMPWPEGTRIYEIDTPDVHAFKEELLARTDLEPTAEPGTAETRKPAVTTPSSKTGSFPAPPPAPGSRRCDGSRRTSGP
jgi:methyltransferase (TIGR00027 family)